MRAAQPEDRRANSPLGRDERDTEPAPERHAPVPGRARADVGQLLYRGQDRPPFRHRLLGHHRLELSDERSEFRAGCHACLVPGRDPGVLGVRRPVTMAGHVGRDDGEPAFGDEPASALHDAWCLLVVTATMPHDDEGTRAAGAGRRPQHAGNFAENE